MAHDHVYGICESKCMVEVIDKATQDTINDNVNRKAIKEVVPQISNGILYIKQTRLDDSDISYGVDFIKKGTISNMSEATSVFTYDSIPDGSLIWGKISASEGIASNIVGIKQGNSIYCSGYATNMTSTPNLGAVNKISFSGDSFLVEYCASTGFVGCYLQNMEDISLNYISFNI